MLRSEARRILTEAFPDRSVCIEIDDWRHVREVGEAFNSLAYSIAVLPGLDGSKCTHHPGKTLEQAVNHALACAIVPPPSAAEVDQQFAEAPAEPADIAGEIEADPFAASPPPIEDPDAAVKRVLAR